MKSTQIESFKNEKNEKAIIQISPYYLQNNNRQHTNTFYETYNIHLR